MNYHEVYDLDSFKYFNIPSWIVNFSTISCSLAFAEFIKPVFMPNKIVVFSKIISY